MPLLNDLLNFSDHPLMPPPSAQLFAEHLPGQDHVKYVFCTEKSALIAQKTSDKVAPKTVF
ncbi:hypothetical protein CBX58_005905 [Salmonella enterica]|nr:hypothetical protein [Salmonella enterica]